MNKKKKLGKKAGKDTERILIKLELEVKKKEKKK
mgnify:CR=1 FL=1